MTKENIKTPANAVTMIRILLIPVFVIIALVPWGAHAAAQPWVAMVVFALLAATDGLDGHLARSRNEVTTFGKFLDPLADKILVMAALLVLVEQQQLPSWIPLVIVAREFIVSGLRMLAAADGQIIAASWYGKAKTFVTDIAIVFFLVMDSPAIAASSIHAGFVVLSWVLMVAAVVLTIISMIDYLVKSKSVIGLG
ncbi:MAG: CDP-diacylglycerol--glycerol-3-phosphate 3-phosphatidyltransferase [Coriobacteriales bacterium]|nr:CDP-diacylglycerol--glycerol-3-phosphate 3-phosphatidyltransferase [Coriobacteriales bacterium]